jgi:uncharacterized protein (DUF433 family)
MTEGVLDQHIEITPGIRGGKPHITGSRITVADIVLMHCRLGVSLEEIAGKYDLPLASVYAAMSYYYDHQQDVDQSIEDDKAFADYFQSKTPSLLQEKLKAPLGDLTAITDSPIIQSDLIAKYSDKKVGREEQDISCENEDTVNPLHDHIRLLDELAETACSPETRSELAEVSAAFLLAAINSGAVTLQQIYQVFKTSRPQDVTIPEPDPNVLSLAQQYQSYYNLDPVAAIFHGYKNSLGLCDDLTDEMRESVRRYRERHGLSEIEARIEMFRDFAGLVIPTFGLEMGTMREEEEKEGREQRETA